MKETDMNPTTTLKIATSLCALMVAMPAQAQEEQGQQDDVQVLSSWNYDPLYAEGWNVENMFDMTEVVDANGEDIGDIENVIFSNEGEVLGIIAQVGGFWDILDTKAYPFAYGRPTSSAMKACRRAVFM